MEYRVSLFFFFSSRRRHTRCSRDWSSDVCSSDLVPIQPLEQFGLNADLVLAAIGGHLPLLLEDRAHCVAAELQTARHLAYAHALLVEQKHPFALVRFDHGVSSRCRKKLAAGSRSRPSANSPGRERPESSACGPRSCPSPAACTSR